MIDNTKVKNIKKQFPKGTELELISMEKPKAVPSGTHGIVKYVDDTGTIFMKWDNGSSLGLAIDKVQFKVIKKPNPAFKKLEKAKKQLNDNDDLILFTYNKKTKNTGIAIFIQNKNEVKVLEGKPDGSDDSTMNYDKFINNYKFKVANEDDDPFKDMRENSYNNEEKTEELNYFKNENSENIISKLKEKYSLSIYYESSPFVVYQIKNIEQNIFIEYKGDKWIGVYKDYVGNMEMFNSSAEDCLERIILYIDCLTKYIRI